LKILRIISFVGAILSICATLYTSTQYLVLTQNAKVIEALAPGDDVMSSKIATILQEQTNRELILKELNSRWEHSALLHSVMTKMNTDATKRALNEVFLWVGSCAIFTALLIGFELLRRNKVPKIPEVLSGTEPN
jgi:hypothetical protein